MGNAGYHQPDVYSLCLAAALESVALGVYPAFLNQFYTYPLTPNPKHLYHSAFKLVFYLRGPWQVGPRLSAIRGLRQDLP